MKNNIKFVRIIFIVNLIFGVLLSPDYASAETMLENGAIPESVPDVHFFLESLNSESFIWFFRCIFIIGVLIALINYLYFLNYKNKQEENELFNTLGIDFTIKDEGRKE
ncbi:hypothetical protein NNC19_07060 [Clostridium sp. SHJSY1]|uniref:hypothetical protein n=1 Tax=Clostridium sp. SHJSY1 TaxID=2942483 RepID=UPI0028756CF8|nr:hypothetical protein [Clostridium sp. SHJSY1]MDS0525432.1 hypothetical protein [Clostridium sp. SHJSY1]